VVADVGVEPPEGAAVTVDGEVGHPPDAFAQDVDDRADVEELHPAARGAQVGDLQPGRARRRGLAVGIAVEPLAGERPDEPLDQVERGRGPHVLGEVGATVGEHPRDLLPAGPDGMTAAHQREAPVGERQGLSRPDGDDLDATRREQPPGALGVGRPSLGDHHPWRQPRRLGDDLAAPGVDVERRVDEAEAGREQSRVSPRRPLLGRPPVEPVEAPPGHVDRGGLVDELIEGAHTHIVPTPGQVR